MVLSRHDYGKFRRTRAPYLQPTSNTFGLADVGELEGAFRATAGVLQRRLLRLTSDLGSGRIGVQRFTNAATAAIFNAYFNAYSLGALSVFPFYTLTDRDIRLLNDELFEEAQFLRAFGNDIVTSRLVLDPITRSRLYLLALRGIFEKGRVEAMPPGPYRWRLGITEHCVECFRASVEGPYQKDRQSGLGLPPLPGAPGDGSVCLGLTRCGCTIVLANGSPLPNEELAQRLRGLLLEVVNGPRTVAAGTTTDTGAD